MEAAMVVKSAKEAGMSTELASVKEAMAICLAYEAKARLMESLSKSADMELSIDEAWARAKDSVWLVYARLGSKRSESNMVFASDSIESIYRSTDDIGKSRMILSCPKVISALQMASQDLGRPISVGRYGPSEGISVLSRLIGVSSFFESAGTDRETVIRSDAERRKMSPRDWLSKTPTKSVFGGDSLVLIEDVMSESLSRFLGISKTFGTQPRPRYSRRSKVRYVDGSASFQRNRYGRETHQSIRHGSIGRWQRGQKLPADASTLGSQSAESESSTPQGTVRSSSVQSIHAHRSSSPVSDVSMSVLAHSAVDDASKEVEKSELAVRRKKPKSALGFGKGVKALKTEFVDSD
jgi:hypothetical protein